MKYEKGSFITVPNKEKLLGIDPQAQCLYLWLCYHANQSGECFPSIRRLSEETGMKKDSVIKATKILLEKGILKKVTRKKGKENLTNVYEVIILGVVGHTDNLVGHTDKGVVGQTDSELNPLSLTKSTKLPFDLFWNLYDKKTGRPKSEKKWNALSLKDQEAILEYIPKYKIAQPNKTYRKNPETFFNNRSWEDELIVYGTDTKGKWKCKYGHIHEKGEECGHDLERRYQNSEYSQELKSKFQIRR